MYSIFKYLIACPSSHSHAFHEGKKCCRTSRENANNKKKDSKIIKSCPSDDKLCHDIEACNGKNLTIMSTCCEDNAFINCPNGQGCLSKELKGTHSI